MFEPPFNGVVLDDVAQVLSTLREANADLAVDHRLVSVSKKQSVDETHQNGEDRYSLLICLNLGRKIQREFGVGRK